MVVLVKSLNIFKIEYLIPKGLGLKSSKNDSQTLLKNWPTNFPLKLTHNYYSKVDPQLLLKIDLKTLFKKFKTLTCSWPFLYQKLATTINTLLMLLFNNLCFMASCRLLLPKKIQVFSLPINLKYWKLQGYFGLFQKKNKQDELRAYFWKGLMKFLGFKLYPVQTPDKTKASPKKLHKILFHSSRPKIPHNLFFITLKNSTLLLNNPWKFHCYSFNTLEIPEPPMFGFF